MDEMDDKNRYIKKENVDNQLANVVNVTIMKS